MWETLLLLQLSCSKSWKHECVCVERWLIVTQIPVQVEAVGPGLTFVPFTTEVDRYNVRAIPTLAAHAPQAAYSRRACMSVCT